MVSFSEHDRSTEYDFLNHRNKQIIIKFKSKKTEEYGNEGENKREKISFSIYSTLIIIYQCMKSPIRNITTHFTKPRFPSVVC